MRELLEDVRAWRPKAQRVFQGWSRDPANSTLDALDKAPEGVIIEPEFLDEAALKTPSLALENVRRDPRTGTITLRKTYSC